MKLGHCHYDTAYRPFTDILPALLVSSSQTVKSLWNETFLVFLQGPEARGRVLDMY